MFKDIKARIEEVYYGLEDHKDINKVYNSIETIIGLEMNIKLPVETIKKVIASLPKSDYLPPHVNIAKIDVTDICNSIKDHKNIYKGILIKDFMDKYKINSTELDLAIQQIRSEGIQLEVDNIAMYINKDIIPVNNIHATSWTGDKIIKFGVVSDTHIGSKHQQLTHLNKIYDTFIQEGIDTVYHSGDLTEGENMRKGHQYECFIHGASDIEDYVIDKYPSRPGLTTRFILGNHDASFIKHSGTDIGKYITKQRSDMEYLGMLNARVEITPNCILELNHPLDGASYALSYSLQKLIDSMSGGEKPNILINGHHHKAMSIFYRNIHAIEAGCFESQTSFMKGKRIAANIGGYIITVHVNDIGQVTRFIPEFIPVYNSIQNDY